MLQWIGNPPSNSRNVGLILSTGRFHMMQSNKVRVPQLLSMHFRAHEPQLLSICAATIEVPVPTACALKQEKPPWWEAQVPQWRVAPFAATRESPWMKYDVPVTVFSDLHILKYLFCKQSCKVRNIVPTLQRQKLR